MITIETARLAMRPFTLGDLDRHVELYSDPEVTKYLPRGVLPPDRIRAACEWTLNHFIEHWARHGFGVWALVERASGVLVGQCGLQHLGDTGEVEVLYLLERRCWNHGLATEAACAALGYGFDRLGLDRIVAVTRPEHRASRRVMERLGMRYEKDTTVYNLAVVYYALSREAFGRAEVSRDTERTAQGSITVARDTTRRYPRPS